MSVSFSLAGDRAADVHFVLRGVFCLLLFVEVNAQTKDLVVRPEAVVGSNDPQWITLRGGLFRPGSAVRLRTTGVDATISDPERIRFTGPDEMAVRANVGADADEWTVEVTHPEQGRQGPAVFQVVAPPPRINSAVMATSAGLVPQYTLFVFGSALSRSSEVLWNGNPVPTEPVYSSPSASALTVGLTATLPADQVQGREGEVRLRTPPPGGGTSAPVAVAMVADHPVGGGRVLWVIALCALAVGGLVAALLLRRSCHLARLARDHTHALREEKRRTEEQAERLRLQTDTLGQQADQLRKQARRLVELDAAKSRFLANVSHEFRTPLTLVTQPIEDLLAGLHGPLAGSVEAELATVRRGSVRLESLIGQLVDLARVQGGKLHLKSSPTEVGRLVRVVVDDFLPLADRDRVSLEYAVGDEVGVGMIDREAVRKSLSNLVQNAISFTPKGGTVLVRATVDQGVLSLAVRDSGPGIAEEVRGRVFERFVQVGSDLRRTHDGLGLGLSLSQDLIRTHGGEIEVESVPGFGATFTIRLPWTPTDAPPVPFDEADQQRGSSRNAAALDDHAARSDEADIRSRPLVLIAEDNPDLRRLLRRTLGRVFRVAEAADGAEAISLVEANRPDLLLTDIMMPMVDGISLIEEIRRREATADLPVLVLSAKGGEDWVERATLAGADGYVHKPYSSDSLVARIQRAIDRRRAMQDRYRREVVRADTAEVLTSVDDTLLEQVLSVIAERMHEQAFGVEALAYDVGLSASQLNRRLSSMGRPSGRQVIIEARLDRAAELLRARVDTVSGIARRVGYRDARYFAERFRDRFGRSPSEYASEAESDVPDAVVTDSA